MKCLGGLAAAVGMIFLGFYPIDARAVSAAPVKLAWDASTNRNVVGYKVCFGCINSTTTNLLNVGTNLSAVVTNLTAGTNYFFQVVACDANGVESRPSNQIQYCPPTLTRVQLAAADDGTMQVQFRGPAGGTCIVQYTDSLDAPNWQVLGSAVAAADGSVAIDDPGISSTGMRFYRAVY